MKHFNSKNYFSWTRLVFSGGVMAWFTGVIILPLTGASIFDLSGIAWAQPLVNVVTIFMFAVPIVVAGYVFVNQLRAYSIVRYPYGVMRRLFKRRGLSSAPKIFTWGGDRYVFSKTPAGYSIEIMTKGYQELFTVSRHEVHMLSKHSPLTLNDRRALVKATRFISGFYQLSTLPAKASRQTDVVTVSDGVSTVDELFADATHSED